MRRRGAARAGAQRRLGRGVEGPPVQRLAALAVGHEGGRARRLHAERVLLRPGAPREGGASGHERVEAVAPGRQQRLQRRVRRRDLGVERAAQGQRVGNAAAEHRDQPGGGRVVGGERRRRGQSLRVGPATGGGQRAHEVAPELGAQAQVGHAALALDPGLDRRSRPHPLGGDARIGAGRAGAEAVHRRLVDGERDDRRRPPVDGRELPQLPLAPERPQRVVHPGLQPRPGVGAAGADLQARPGGDRGHRARPPPPRPRSSWRWSRPPG